VVGGEHRIAPAANLWQCLRQFFLRPQQRRAMALSGERWLQICQVNALAKDPLGRRAAEIAQACSGYHGDGKSVRSFWCQIEFGTYQQRGAGFCDGRFVASDLPARLDAEQDQIRGRQVAATYFHPEPVDFVPGVPEARGVHQPYRPAEKIDMDLDRVARGARDLGHQGALTPQQGVEEGGLSRIRPPGEYEQSSFPEPLGCWRGVHQVLDLRRHGTDLGRDSLGCDRTVVFLGEVDVVAQQCLDLEQ
jgi:hypothetical protein